MIPSPFGASVAATTPLKQSGHEVKANSNAPSSEIKTHLKTLDESEVERANHLYVTLIREHQKPAPVFYIAIDQIEGLNTLVGFRRSGERQPELIYIQDGYGTPPPRGGGYGSVYLSHRLSRSSDNQWVFRSGPQYERVMKVQDETDAAQSEAQFLIEQRGTYGTGVIAGKRYLDQSRISGVDLAEQLCKRDWSERARFECAVSILQCARDFVAGGHVHPDVKPENMMYDPDSGKAQLIDHARVVDAEDHPSMLSCPGFNTHFYASPEQYRHGKISEKTMVYSLGITLLNLFSDNPSLFDVAESKPATTRGIKLNLNNLLPKLRKKNKELVSQLEGLLLDMVAKNEQKRPDIKSCLDRLVSFAHVHKEKLKCSAEIKKQQEQLDFLQRQLRALKEDKAGGPSREQGKNQKGIRALEKQFEKQFEKQCLDQQTLISKTFEQSETEQLSEEAREKADLLASELNELELELDLKAKEKSHEKRATAIGGFSERNSQLESVHQQPTAEPVPQALPSQRTPLQDMLKLAHDNPPEASQDKFIEMLPGAFNHLPLETSAEYLTNLFARIITNERDTGQGSLPYAPPVKRFWSSAPERLFNPSETQIAHLKAVQSEAEKLLLAGLNGDDKARRYVCKWLDKSLVFSCPYGSSLKDGFTFYHRMQSHLSAIPEAWKYRDQGAKLEQWLAEQLTDGRKGKPENIKSVPTFMADLSKSPSLEAVSMKLFYRLKPDNFVERMKLLEAAFSHVILSVGAYTRDDRASTDSYFPPRQDIAGASGTQIEHAVIFQNIARQLIEARSKSGVQLSAKEVTQLCQSRLIKFNPVQYHSQVASCPSTLAVFVQQLCESSLNFNELKKSYLGKPLLLESRPR